jgi:hypothetical protein
LDLALPAAETDTCRTQLLCWAADAEALQQCYVPPPVLVRPLSQVISEEVTFATQQIPLLGLPHASVGEDVHSQGKKLMSLPFRYLFIFSFSVAYRVNVSQDAEGDIEQIIGGFEYDSSIFE